MPLRRLPHPLQPSPREPVIIPRPAPPKLGVIQTTSPLIADYRVQTIWYAIMERSYLEAFDKLKKTVKDDFHDDPQKIDELIPCVIELDEARTKREEEAIRRVHRKLAEIYAGFVDRLVRYRIESRPLAWDYLKDEMIRWKPYFRQYVCENFRKAEAKEEDPLKRKRRKGKWD